MSRRTHSVVTSQGSNRPIASVLVCNSCRKSITSTCYHVKCDCLFCEGMSTRIKSLLWSTEDREAHCHGIVAILKGVPIWSLPITGSPDFSSSKHSRLCLLTFRGIRPMSFMRCQATRRTRLYRAHCDRLQTCTESSKDMLPDHSLHASQLK